MARFINPAFRASRSLATLAITPTNYCTSAKGAFDDTTPAQMEAAMAEFAKVSEQKPLALFFHGGLVDKASGMSNAQQLVGSYSAEPQQGTGPAGNAFPYFFVWESYVDENRSCQQTRILRAMPPAAKRED